MVLMQTEVEQEDQMTCEFHLILKDGKVKVEVENASVVASTLGILMSSHEDLRALILASIAVLGDIENEIPDRNITRQ